MNVSWDDRNIFNKLFILICDMGVSTRKMPKLKLWY